MEITWELMRKTVQQMLDICTARAKTPMRARIVAMVIETDDGQEVIRNWQHWPSGWAPAVITEDYEGDMEEIEGE